MVVHFVLKDELVPPLVPPEPPEPLVPLVPPPVPPVPPLAPPPRVPLLPPFAELPPLPLSPPSPPSSSSSLFGFEEHPRNSIAATTPNIAHPRHRTKLIPPSSQHRVTLARASITTKRRRRTRFFRAAPSARPPN
jgi:hypothetical protein